MTATQQPPQQVEELTAAYVDAWQRHDIDDIVSFHTPDTVYSSRATGREAIGLDAVREALTTVFAIWPDLRFFQHCLHMTPELIVFESTAQVTQAVPVPGDTMIEPTGTSVRFDVADVLAVRDGKIARKDSYVDALGYLREMRAAGAVTYPSTADRVATTAATSPLEGEPMPVEAQEMVSYVGLGYVATTSPTGSRT